jgi:hypothetical protein
MVPARTSGVTGRRWCRDRRGGAQPDALAVADAEPLGVVVLISTKPSG